MQSKWAGVLPQPHLDLAGGIALWRPAGPSSGSANSSWKLFTPCVETAATALCRRVGPPRGDGCERQLQPASSRVRRWLPVCVSGRWRNGQWGGERARAGRGAVTGHITCSSGRKRGRAPAWQGAKTPSRRRMDCPLISGVDRQLGDKLLGCWHGANGDNRPPGITRRPVLSQVGC